MDQFRKLFSSLSIAQRVAIGITLMAFIAGIASFVHWRRESDFRPLFTGMAPEDAAAIVQKLKESGVDFRLSENGSSVLVPTSRVDELRLEMAGAGLPRTGRIGFELFDKTNLGITDFTEHINYRRALEGELERSIRSLSGVEQARAHISFPKESVFLDSREPAKASVLLTLRPGARLSEANIQAVTNLVASAVEGLSPDYVSVVDMRGNLLSKPKKLWPENTDGADSALEYKHQVEKDLLAKVESTLTPLLGENHFRAGISADCDFTTSEQTDESFDPTRSVMTASQKSEDLAGAPQTGGVPGTPSNLPRPTSRPVGSGSSVSRKTENLSYETSRTVRQVKTPRGAIKHLSASLLIDQEVKWEGAGSKAKRTLIPPSPEKLKAIHDIVAGVIGLTPDRGDQLVVQSLPFEQEQDSDIASQGPVKPAVETDSLKKLMGDPKLLAGAGVAVLLIVGLALFGLTRRTKKGAEARVQATLASAKPTASAEGDTQTDTAQLTAKAQGMLSEPDTASRIEKLRASMQGTVARDPAVAASVIRSWMTEQAS